VAIGEHRDELIDSVAEGDRVLLFGYHRDLARVTLSSVPRDGAAGTVIARHTERGEPKAPAFTSEAVYYTRNKTLYRMDRSDGNVEALAKAFSYAVGVKNGFVYGVGCDGQDADRLVRVGVRGGEVEAVVDIPRGNAAVQDGSTFRCDYRSILADDDAIYLSHWNSRRLLRVELSSHKLSVLTTKQAFVDHLHVQDGQLVFQSSKGLHRASTTRPEVVRFGEIGQGPFTFLAYGREGVYVHQGVPYGLEESTYFVPWTTAPTEKLESWRALDPHQVPPDTGIRGLAVDDECLYVARSTGAAIRILARSLGTSP
jgi:hypothetical protein